MKINIQTVHFSMNSNLQKYIDKRLSKAQLALPGDDVVVDKKSESFEKSLDIAASTAERMLKRRKDKARIS
jgi:ribosome-associated translation inhibitor RaiA